MYSIVKQELIYQLPNSIFT